jgi:hypothetical protein
MQNKRHFIGKPCRHGHSGRRYVKGGACIECSMVRLKAIPGSIHYIGKPCPHGHSGLRYSKGGQCVECRLIYSATFQAKHRSNDGAIHFQGSICAHGHSGLRYSKSGHCVECALLKKRSPVHRLIPYAGSERRAA